MPLSEKVGVQGVSFRIEIDGYRLVIVVVRAGKRLFNLSLVISSICFIIGDLTDGVEGYVVIYFPLIV